MKRPRWIVFLFVSALVLAACPGDDGEEAAGECEADQTDGDLALYNWSDYMDPDIIDQFEAEYDVSVTQDEYPSNEEMLARIQAGGAGYDVIVPSDYTVEIMIGQDLLLPLNHDAIPNIDNLGEFFRGDPYDPGNEYSVAYQWGTTGLGVNIEAVEEALGEVPDSWDLVFDPEIASNFSGQISLLDDAREVMSAALLYLGYDNNTEDEDELTEARDLIREARENVATFTSLGYPDLLAGGETVIGHGYSGDLLLAIEDSEAGELDYIIPAEEGAVVWVDNLAIPADAPNPCTAHTFLNYILDDEIGAQLSNWSWYASPNEAAEPMIDEEVLSVYPEDELLEELYFIRDIGEATPMYEQMFTEAKS